MAKRTKVVLIMVGAVLITTLGIEASDIARGIQGALSGSVIESEVGPCGNNAVFMQFGGRALCVDQFEASPHEDCVHTNPASSLDTETNVADSACRPVSASEVLPWRFVNQAQAAQLCAREGKRLPTNDEWYKITNGQTNIENCHIDDTQATETGLACSTPTNVYDMIGNVWEWVDAEVVDGNYNGRAIPPTGYVAAVDTDGVVLETSDSPQVTYGSDYAQTNDTGVYGVVRGGFYGSGEDAGLYAVNAAVPLTLQTPGVGFRCVRDSY